MEKFFEKEEDVSLVNCDVKKLVLPQSANDLKIIASTSTQVIKSEKEYQVERIDESKELSELSELSAISINQKVTMSDQAGKCCKCEAG